MFETTFHGIFNNLEELNQYFRDRPQDFYEVMCDYNSEYKDAYLSKDKKYPFYAAANSASPSDLYFKSQISEFNNTQTLKILEIGGGINPCFFCLDYWLDQPVEVLVVELPKVSRKCNKIYDDIPGLSYCDRVPTGATPFDVVYFSASFQYTFNTEDILLKVVSHSPKKIITTSTILLEQRESLITGQVNMGKRVIPYKMNNKDEIINQLDNLNYELSHEEFQRGNWSHNELDQSEFGMYHLTFQLKN